MRTPGAIAIRGARQNNLQGVDVDIPQESLVAVTGVSGSGKSSLAFDTLFREGQRRFLETLSSYARQFLGRMEKPDVDSIEGLSPTLAVDQKTTSATARSTVGTLTEIYDHLRVLFARAGDAHCPACDSPLSSETEEGIVQRILSEEEDQAVLLLAPIVRDRKGHHRSVFEDLQKQGFVRVRVDGEVQRIEQVGELARYKRHTVEVVVDRLRVDPSRLGRLRESVQQALALGKGELVLQGRSGDRSFSTQRSCKGCGANAPALEPRLFSFNSPHGACSSCDGLGQRHEASASAVVRSPGLSVREGALAVTRKGGGGLAHPRVDFRFLEQVAAAHGFSLDTPWEQLDKHARRILLEGSGEERFEDRASWAGERYQGSVRWRRRFHGVLPTIERAYTKGQRKLGGFMGLLRCKECGGSRLNAAARAVRLGGVSLAELVRLPVAELDGTLARLKLLPRQARIASDLLAEIRRRSGFLIEVGLEYLALERSADTLSGGEAQRIRLAAQLGAGLVGVTYILDEPTIGLHQRDCGRLLGALAKLRDQGNTVVVVEHDELALRAADCLIDVGPQAGKEGGRISGVGTPEEIARLDTPTGRFLRGELDAPAPESRRKGNGKVLAVRGARAFNLKGIDVEFPLGTLTVVSGVSGSGKSTLVHRVLLGGLQNALGLEAPKALECDRIEGLEHVGEVVAIDSKPIGRTPRSNPATYTGTLGPIRDLFAALPEARMRGYTKSRFSFNVAGGRCEECGGAGAKLVELQFLAPVTVVCEVCGGHRFQDETLDVRFKGCSIADVLGMTIAQAQEFFRDQPRIARPLRLLEEIGVGYLTLGQPSTTLSGGEAQRVKLARHLQRRPRAHALFVLDEPTTGLHQQDVQRLLQGLQRLVEQGHTVLVIEHNLEVLSSADHVIDLGPEGGAGGGRVVATGTPEELARAKDSHTARALRERAEGRAKAFGGRKSADGFRRGFSPGFRNRGEARNEIEIVGARTHNLKSINLRIPRDALTVITGPSGSGKSSLALDTLHAEGRARFVESLSTYARQFLGAGDRPPVDRIEGLGPSVAVEASTVRGHPRSSVATTTEIHDHLRVLWARAGTPRCPEHGRVLKRSDPGSLARSLSRTLEGRKGFVLAPYGAQEASADEGAADGPHAPNSKVLREQMESWRAAGFARALVDHQEVRLDGKESSLEGQRVDLVVDRLSFGKASRARLAEAIEQAAAVAGGRVSVLALPVPPGEETRVDFSTRGACAVCGFQIGHTLEPRHFSFNTHAGACPACDGLGALLRCDAERLVVDPSSSVLEGALSSKFGRYLTKGKGYYENLLREVARSHRIELDQPFEKLSAAARELLLHGRGARKGYQVVIERSTTNSEVEERFSAQWPGLCGQVDAWYQRAEDPGWIGVLESVMSRTTCPTCKGERLRGDAAAVTIGTMRLPELLQRTVAQALQWLESLELSAAQQGAVQSVLDQLRSRLGLLDRVGLGYLALDRPTSTLSGGEARRVRLSASLGSRLCGVCYVLDEPTVGLHPSDVARLSDALLELRDLGNTVVVVEHDELLMERADQIIDLGPDAGRGGGEVVAQGTPSEIRAHPRSKTGAALRGELIPSRPGRRDVPPAGGSNELVLRGARAHNLKQVDFTVRFGALTGVCGASGSGKSTLVLDCLVPALNGEKPNGRWRSLVGAALAARVVVVDASPIGRTPASVPATYTGLIEVLRELFARTSDARVRGLGPSSFSFNSANGRCQACEGKGATKVEMQFLADLWLSCEECGGARYRPEVLEVRHRGRSIADVLAMSVDEAAKFLVHQPRAAAILSVLQRVGLGYMPLGQSSTTLSGGEAQRLKLCSELLLAERSTRAVIVLDEPTTGLHACDVEPLVAVLDALVRAGNAVVVIEHHTGLLSTCDHLVDLGPGGGEEGGRIVAQGSPQELAKDPRSKTGPWLPMAARGAGRGRRTVARRTHEVAG